MEAGSLSHYLQGFSTIPGGEHFCLVLAAFMIVAGVLTQTVPVNPEVVMVGWECLKSMTWLSNTFYSKSNQVWGLVG